jgi:uncharacterized protein YndB with AHSA1/START domain
MTDMKVERSVWIAATPERVWQAITDVKQLERWFAPGRPWEIPALQMGAAVKFYNTLTEILEATIEVLNPPHEFTLRWLPDVIYPASDLVTSFLLQPENGGTRATLTETGYETLPDAMRQQHMTMAGEGYEVSMETLKTLLEAGAHK